MTPQEALARALRDVVRLGESEYADASDAILDALPEGWALLDANGVIRDVGGARERAAQQERERLRALLNEYEEWLIQQHVYGNGGGWGEAAMTKVWSLLADPEPEP